MCTYYPLISPPVVGTVPQVLDTYSLHRFFLWAFLSVAEHKVRMLRLHADAFRLKPDMLVAFGHSAGEVVS